MSSSQPVDELKAFARECVVGIPVEFSTGENRRGGVFSIDQTLRTAQVKDLTIDLSTMSFIQEPPTWKERMFASAPKSRSRLVRIVGTESNTRAQSKIEIFLPDSDAADRFCCRASALASMVRGQCVSPHRAGRLWQDHAYDLAVAEVVQHTKPEQQEGVSRCGPTGSACGPSHAESNDPACWTVFSLCDGSSHGATVPLADITVSNKPRSVQSWQTKDEQQSFPSHFSHQRNPAAFDENVFFK
jgi:hypothetical protein